MKTASLLLVLGLLLSACSTSTSIPSVTNNWHQDMPPASYFSEYYQKDNKHQQVATEEEYLLWVKRFYMGWALYRRGWLQASDELVDSLENPTDQALAKTKALEIGRLVSAEWAKDDRFRIINTGHVSIWGNALLEAMVKKEQFKILDQISEDINELLSEKIQPIDIAANRYYPTQEFGTDIVGEF